MILEEIQIEGFRSLKSVTWKPGRLNVLIGPNGGGKSNLLASLDLVRVSANGDLRKRVLQQGGMVALAWNGSGAVRFRMKTEPEMGRNYDYDFALDRVGSSGLHIVSSERLTASDGSALIERPVPNDSPQETSLSLFRGVGEDPIALFRNFIKSWSVYRSVRVDEKAEVRAPAVTRFEKRVESEGQNLIPVLHTLYEEDRDFEDMVDTAMSSAFPDDYEKLKFPAASDGKVQLQLRRRSRRSDGAADLSDGTIRFLLLLAILGTSDLPPLIAIDEPETGLHPRMMSIITAVAANTAMKSQVIFTTHSPQFLDAFDKDDPPTTTVVTTNGSETELKTISGDDLKKWVEDYSLGKFAFSGEAEAVL